MDFEQARHFLQRTHFGGTPAAIHRTQRQDPVVLMQIMIDALGKPSMLAAPAWHKNPYVPAAPNTPLYAKNQQQLLSWRAWWIQNMIATDTPLTEYLVLLWYRFFGVSAARVGSAPLIARHHLALRKHATGNFETLLKAMLRDPAVLLHYGATEELKRKPNMGLADALLQRFTLGDSQPADREAAARALTGWYFHTGQKSFVFEEKYHDNSQFTFLNHTARFDADGLVGILLKSSAVSERIATALWLTFISEIPPRDEIERLGSILVTNNYELKPLLLALFNTPHFFAAENRNSLVKSPLELIVQIARVLYLPIQDHTLLARAAQSLSQDPLEPPAQGQWPRNSQWLTSQGIALRRRLIHALLRGKGMGGRTALYDERSLATWLGKPNLKPARARKEAARVLLGSSPLSPPPSSASPEDTLLKLMSDPVFQLK